ncbi:hypothetical protein PtA15_12A337 [Puccinia triticina]|uniref:Uncharacterized protein n=1 Tax=Puccinia triticina TaxID=208348 RepID=A0ABY7CZL3_9BASI|nr:uncharacterized protein PtA15_12A337 [Puccinia triticina]WAQ90348.1 hypothetical protein PtA15_12A337 [Puccinia triticina]
MTSHSAHLRLYHSACTTLYAPPDELSTPAKEGLTWFNTYNARMSTFFAQAGPRAMRITSAALR